MRELMIPVLFRLTALLVVFAVLLGACAEEVGMDASTNPTGSTTTTVRVSSSTSMPATAPSSTITTVPDTTTTTTTPDLGEELVANSDFSSGANSPSAWELTPQTASQSVDYVTESGEQHISFFAPLVEDTPWPEARSTVPFDVRPHTDYQLEVEARAVTEGRLFLALIFLDEDGDEILLRGPGSPEISEPDWERVEATLESPAGAAAAYIVMRLAVRPDLTGVDASSVDVNRVSVREVRGT